MTVICEMCKNDMNKSDGCLPSSKVFASGTEMESVKYGDEDDVCPPTEEGRCPDCGAKLGHYHHQGCNIEICPKCRQQALICECDFAEEEEGGWTSFINVLSEENKVIKFIEDVLEMIDERGLLLSELAFSLSMLNIDLYRLQAEKVGREATKDIFKKDMETLKRSVL